MKTIAQFLDEQKEWSERNFGRHDPWQPFLGMMEELGELAHSHLKEAQNIRGSKEQHEEDAKDAVADVLIYMLDYINSMCTPVLESHRTFESFQISMKHYSKGYPPHAWIQKACVHLGRVADATVNPHKYPNEYLDYLWAMINCLACYCEVRGWDLQQIVEETWEKVRKRDWKKDPVGGNANAEG